MTLGFAAVPRYEAAAAVVVVVVVVAVVVATPLVTATRVVAVD
jgi:hypothetical protein